MVPNHHPVDLDAYDHSSYGFHPDSRSPCWRAFVSCPSSRLRQPATTSGCTASGPSRCLAAAVNDRAAVPPLPLRSATAVRPLRIALTTAADGSTSGTATGSMARSMLAQATRSRLLSLPVPTKPAIVSIYEDRTLRNGDAVMLGDGIHIFRGDAAGQHRPRDFVRLPLAASLGWQVAPDLERSRSQPADTLDVARSDARAEAHHLGFAAVIAWRGSRPC